MTKKISAVLAVKNEEKRIVGCLESIKWVDEIIIIDMHSTDKTIKLCRKYTNKIFTCEGGPKGLIEYNKNFGFKKAKSDWILLIDADERASPLLKEELFGKIRNAYKIGFLIHSKTYFLGKPLKCAYLNEFGHVRLFRNGAGFYPCNKNHEKLIITGKLGKFKEPFIHLWDDSIKDFIRKINLYSTQDARCLDVGLYDLLIKPFLIFLWIFLFKKGYKDGKRGLILSLLLGSYFFLKKAKSWENYFKKCTKDF